jgi:hypothetical protein
LAWFPWFGAKYIDPKTDCQEFPQDILNFSQVFPEAQNLIDFPGVYGV